MMNNSFECLKLNKEFKRMYHRAKYKAHPLLVTYIMKQNHKTIRLGITASKKAGNAVKRNRARRIIKTAFIQLINEIPIGYDFVFVARESTYSAKMDEIKNVIQKHIVSIIRGNV